ncbi:Hypothetical protein, putative [Bodo saltans]|uniref:Uncharacterized protein n=1 Tax=Bodo saltans TaxID=75058 RepID=A0A0S4ISU7_BODSA|nr:Hypothetical protein, putative [Bodo saltans]|eukprot:CUF65252.1 Hypothetical protein, putative [Bodo saltans]
MVAGSLPASFASAKRCNVSHVAHRNELEAQSVRYAAMETDALRTRERMSSKYAYVSPRVNPPPPAPTAASAKYRTISPLAVKKAPQLAASEIDGAAEGVLVVTEAPATSKTKEEEEEEAAVAAQLVMPQQQHTGQLLCPGGESRNVDRNQEQTVLSSWDKLSIPRRVLEAHDLFVVTAGRVKPYATQTQSPRRPAVNNNSGGPASPRALGSEKQTASSSTEPLSPRTPSVRKGLSHLKNSSSVEVCFAAVAGCGSSTTTTFTPRAASPKQSQKAVSSPTSHGKKHVALPPIAQQQPTSEATPKQKRDVSEDLPELHQAPGDALTAGDEPRHDKHFSCSNPRELACHFTQFHFHVL